MLATCLALMTAQLPTLDIQDPEVESKMYYLGNDQDPSTRIGIYSREVRVKESKKSPKLFGDPPQPYLFDWVMAGFGRLESDDVGKFSARFRVYSQSSRTHKELAPGVTRMLMRLWDYSARSLKIDHSREINSRVVDLYLCYGGTPGGEQLFDEDIESDRRKRVNTMYIYDLPSFKEPIEMAREVAHEYGHAILWPIGGYRVPEDWGNGVFGEKIFLTYLRNELQAKRLTPEDAMGVMAGDLDEWVKKNVTPHIEAAAASGPSSLLEDGVDKGAMDASVGLIQYMQEILPGEVFRQGMKLASGQGARANGLAPAFVEAVKFKEGCVLAISEVRRKKPFWVPLTPSGTVRNATILSRKGDWAKIKMGIGVATLVHKP